MRSPKRRSEHLSEELRALVGQSAAVLGEVIRTELGHEAYEQIEALRLRMASLRESSQDAKLRALRKSYRELEKMTPEQRLETARAFALLLELMNVCENAYRNRQIQVRHLNLPEGRPDSIVYVLTAHPTEARSPTNIWIFHQIQKLLTQVLATWEGDRCGELQAQDRERLRHWLEVAWKGHAVRFEKPRVQDEAEHIYASLLNRETLSAFLETGRRLAPLYVRSWVGGDKDGHPGVDEKVFLDSLQRSRRKLVEFARYCIARLREIATAIRSDEVESLCLKAAGQLDGIEVLEAGDWERVVRFRETAFRLIREYESELAHVEGSASQDFRSLLKVFPALVVPLEFREHSGLLMSDLTGKSLAIFRMLQQLARISAEGDPRWYVRGFVISMTEDIHHVRQAAFLVRRALNAIRIPVIPLFEQSKALEGATHVVQEMISDREIKKAAQLYWNNNLEVMLGYSDTSKECGVLPSRLKIAKAMHELDRLIRAQGLTPVFFQGSGGSVDRGGGTIADQTSGWSQAALRNYKVTLQGEVVERSLASPQILRGQVERIVESAGNWKRVEKRKYTENRRLEAFSRRVEESYRGLVGGPAFAEIIEHATPYAALDVSTIGSRPAKRRAGFSITELRAIPWVLCWTQTRLLLPIWWGVGTAWRAANRNERAGLKRNLSTNPVFATFVRALGFSLTKVELPVWRIYLEQGGLSRAHVQQVWKEFSRELKDARAFAHAMLGKDLLGWRPWLKESILLRAPMIHPLNLLQVISLKTKDYSLFRLTLLGVSTGMMSTG
jgi:phosphoenolpyruvate carboxylase